MSNEIIRGFDEVAKDYDEQRRHLIPCFDDFYFHAVWALPDLTEQHRVLDLGAGTGLLSAFVKARHPTAHITLVDLSSLMMERARDRFSGVPGIEYLQADYLHDEIGGPFDAVISALSIHHFSHADKQRLFGKIYDLCKPGGVFINADQSLGESSAMDARYNEEWTAYIEGGPLSSAEIQAAYHRMSKDSTARLSEQITWMKSSGFVNTECIYRHRNFTVLYAERSSE